MISVRPVSASFLPEPELKKRATVCCRIRSGNPCFLLYEIIINEVTEQAEYFHGWVERPTYVLSLDDGHGLAAGS